MKLTFPTPSGSRILEIKGMDMRGISTWLRDNRE